MIRPIFILTFVFLVLAGQTFAQQTFSASQLKEDLLFYKSKLEQYHPNLYLYTSKERIDAFFDSLSKSINRPMGEEAFLPIITQTSRIVKDGHTLILPSNAFIEWHNSRSKFLPLQIGLYKDNLYVNMNCTQSALIEDGTIINSINGWSSKEIIQALTDRQVRDGESLAYSKWILNAYFREYYSYTFGHPESYAISFDKNGLAQTALIPSLVKDSIYFYREKNYPEIYARTELPKGIYADYDTNRHTVILTIKDFHSEVLKSAYHQNFTTEIKSIFEGIFSANPENLVIDLRDNQGGDIENGALLLSYLIDRPFTIVEAYTRVKKGRPVACKGPCPGTHQPGKNHFKGQIYVITNGGSFSNSAIVSAALKRYTNAVFVGSETGGNPVVLAGYAKDLELPHTKIRVEIPTKRFTMDKQAKNNGKGLVPNYAIEQSIQDNINRFDRQMDFVMQLIMHPEKAGGNKG